MERKYLLVKVMALSSLLLLAGCIGHNLTEQDLVGVWKTNDGGTLVLKEDSSFVISNVSTLINRSLSAPGQIFNGKGKWFLTKNQGNIDIGIECDSYSINGIEISRTIPGLEKPITGFGSYFGISGSGFWGNKPPWKIHTSSVWYDFDETNYTTFEKQE